MEEIEIFFELDITEDIVSSEIPTRAIDFVVNYEQGLVDLNNLKQFKHTFVSEEFYNLAESVKRALEAIKVLFK